MSARREFENRLPSLKQDYDKGPILESLRQDKSELAGSIRWWCCHFCQRLSPQRGLGKRPQCVRSVLFQVRARSGMTTPRSPHQVAALEKKAAESQSLLLAVAELQEHVAELEADR